MGIRSGIRKLSSKIKRFFHRGGMQEGYDNAAATEGTASGSNMILEGGLRSQAGMDPLDNTLREYTG
jgi:hypothetical protein